MKWSQINKDIYEGKKIEIINILKNQPIRFNKLIEKTKLSYGLLITLLNDMPFVYEEDNGLLKVKEA